MARTQPALRLWPHLQLCQRPPCSQPLRPSHRRLPLDAIGCHLILRESPSPRGCELHPLLLGPATPMQQTHPGRYTARSVRLRLSLAARPPLLETLALESRRARPLCLQHPAWLLRRRDPLCRLYPAPPRRRLPPRHHATLHLANRLQYGGPAPTVASRGAAARAAPAPSLPQPPPLHLCPCCVIADQTEVGLHHCQLTRSMSPPTHLHEWSIPRDHTQRTSSILQDRTPPWPAE